MSARWRGAAIRARKASDMDPVAAENARLRARVAELEAVVERLERLADSDTLTPLPNRRFFLRALERSVAAMTRHGTPAALLFVDVDGLKRINDARGHAAGDAALVRVAQTLQAQVRASDVVARIAGDEFGLLLDHLDIGAARAKADALARAVAAGGATVSIGVTALRPGDTAEAALERADAEMYRVKKV